MILCFTKNRKILTDTQHIEDLRSFMRVQEGEPPSPQREACKSASSLILSFF